MPHKSNFATLRKAQNLNWISTNFPKAKLVPQSKHCQRACAREKIRTNAKLINKFRAAKNYIGIFFIFIQKSIFWFRIGILKPLLIIFEIVCVCSTQFSAFCVRKNTFSNEFIFQIRSAKAILPLILPLTCLEWTCRSKQPASVGIEPTWMSAPRGDWFQWNNATWMDMLLGATDRFQ